LNATLGTMTGKQGAGLQYLINRSGPLSVPVNQVGGFVRSTDDCLVPDTQLYCNPVAYSFNNSGSVVVDRQSGYQLSAQPCRPTSTGTIEIISARSADKPRITPRSLTTDVDQVAAINASRMLQRLAGAESLRAVTSGATALDLMALDDDALLENFRQRASTVYHPSCTCRMGTSAQDSVLDA